MARGQASPRDKQRVQLGGNQTAVRDVVGIVPLLLHLEANPLSIRIVKIYAVGAAGDHVGELAACQDVFLRELVNPFHSAGFANAHDGERAL